MFNAKGDKSRTKRLQEDLSFYSVSKDLDKQAGEAFFRKYGLDPDVSRIISISTSGGSLLGNSTRIPIDIVYDEEKIERILISDLNKPTEADPVALVSDNIEVFPESINKIFVRYYRVPRGRTNAGVFSDFVPSLAATLTDQNTAVHFDMPEHYESELALEIAKMIGLHLRDADMYNFSSKEEVPKQNKRMKLLGLLQKFMHKKEPVMQDTLVERLQFL